MRPCFFILCILRAVSVIVAQSHWLHLMAGGILEGGDGRRFAGKKGHPSVSKAYQDSKEEVQSYLSAALI